MSITVAIQPKNYRNRNTYGGVVNVSDFCTDYSVHRNIAKNILSDWSFDKQCKKNMFAVSRRKGYMKNDN